MAQLYLAELDESSEEDDDIDFDSDHNICDFEVKPLFTGRVVYLTEEPRRSFEMTLKGADLDSNKDLPFDVVFWDEAFGIEWKDIVEQAWKQAKGGVLFVDTAFRWASPALAGGNAENDSATMQNVYSPLIQACAGNTTVIVSAHTRKDFDRVPDEDSSIDWLRGSGAVVASSSVVLLYKKPFPVMEDNVRFLRVGRSRLSTPVPEDRYVTLTPEGFTTMSRHHREIEVNEVLQNKVLGLVERIGPEKESVLQDAWQGDNIAFGRALRELVKLNRVKRTGKGGKGNPYIYSVPEQEEGDIFPSTLEHPSEGAKGQRAEQRPEKGSALLSSSKAPRAQGES